MTGTRTPANINAASWLGLFPPRSACPSRHADDMHRALGLLALAASAQAGVIQGVVLEQVSGRPLARTVVTLNPVPRSGGAEAKPLTARAGRSGQFVFPAVAPGLYLLTAARDGYFPSAYGQRLPAGRGTPIEVSADSSFFADLRLRHKGAITGRLLDENGVGTAGVRVVAYRSRLPLRAAGSGVSNDRGVFRIFGLDPGKYWVRSASHTLDDGSGWLPTFGLQGREARDARVHPVTVDGETTDADVSPEPGSLFRLRGMIGCDGDGPVTVTLSSETGRRQTEAGCGGGYEFTNLAPAGYEVFATLRDGSSAAFVELFLDRDTDSGGVQLMQSPPVDFELHLNGVQVRDNMAARMKVGVTGRRQDLAETESERDFVLGRRTTLAPGRWEFRAHPPAGYYVESIVSSYGTPRRRWRPERASDWYEVFIEPRYRVAIRIAMSDRAAQIHGRVMADGKPVPGAPVFLWPVAEAGRRSLAGAPQNISDTQGNFRFGNLPPGDYRVVASFDLNEIDEEIAEECRAATVRVEAAKDATIDLRVWAAP